MIKELDRIKGNPNAVSAYRTGMSALFQGGIIDVLRVLGRPRPHKGGVEAMALEGARSSGWNDCLEALLYFEELYLESVEAGGIPVKMEFGSIESALKSGDLTEGEADAIRGDKAYRYDPKFYTGNIENPVRPKIGV